MLQVLLNMFLMLPVALYLVRPCNESVMGFCRGTCCMHSDLLCLLQHTYILPAIASAGQQTEPGRPNEGTAQQEQAGTSGASDQQQHYGTSSSVYIGSLQWWTPDAEIEALCAPHGAVQKIRFFEEKPSGKSKGYCLVTFDSPKGAYLCRQSLDGYAAPFFAVCCLTTAQGAFPVPQKPSVDD